MILHIGDRIQVENPTNEEVVSHLRQLTPELPYIRLNADADQFLQVIIRKEKYWVEWRQERAHRYVATTLQEAEALFAAFLEWDEAALATALWRPLTLFNDPYRRLILFLILSVTLFCVMAAYRVIYGR